MNILWISCEKRQVSYTHLANPPLNKTLSFIKNRSVHCGNKKGILYTYFNNILQTLADCHFKPLLRFHEIFTPLSELSIFPSHHHGNHCLSLCAKNVDNSAFVIFNNKQQQDSQKHEDRLEGHHKDLLGSGREKLVAYAGKAKSRENDPPNRVSIKLFHPTFSQPKPRSFSPKPQYLLHYPSPLHRQRKSRCEPCIPHHPFHPR